VVGRVCVEDLVVRDELGVAALQANLAGVLAETGVRN
jgi:hypothetical protein